MLDDDYPMAAAEYATAKIAVWWDMNDCPIPEGYDARRVRASMEGAFKKQGYSGPVSITAYGDQKRTPYKLLQGLSSTGVSLVHTISESTCADMYVDMLEWRGRNPPPATMMLISDLIKDVFSWELSRLQQETQYNFFMAYKFNSSFNSSLYASAEWLWESLLAVSETRHKCSKESTGMCYCKPCSFDGKRVDYFRKHLWSREHAIKEAKNLSDRGLDFVSVTRKWARNYPAKPEYATAQIMVLWDMNECPIPEGYDATWVRPSIQGAFKKLGYTGPVSITAYGDHTQTSDHILRGLSSTGVNVAHAFSPVNNNRIWSDLCDWQRVNPPPATMMLISNRVEDFYANFLVTEQQETKYNLFLAYSFRPYQMSILLTSAEWLWESLLTGLCFFSHHPLLTRPILQVHRCGEGAVESFPTDSETRPILQVQKCGEGAVESTGSFYCKSCPFYCKRLEDFREHLSDEQHVEEEDMIRSRNRLTQYNRERWDEEDVLSRIRSSEYKRELRLEVENFPKRKRLRTSFRLLDNHLRRR